MAELLLSPFHFEFMNMALITTLVLSLPCAMLSAFLVLKGWSLLGDAMSHAVCPGVVIAWLIGLPYAIGAFVAGMLCAVATSRAVPRSWAGSEASAAASASALACTKPGVSK